MHPTTVLLHTNIMVWLVVATIIILLYFFGRPLVSALVLWTVAFGGSDSRRRIAQKSRLHAYVARSDLLDEVSMCELYQLCIGMVEKDDGVGIEALQDVVLSYKFVSLYRERVDGSLRGMMLLDEKERMHCGKKIFVFRMGLALFKQHYRGGALPYIFFLYRALRSFAVNRGMPVYVLVKLFSYKTYMVAMNTVSESYPRYDAETPEFEKSLMDEFGASLQAANCSYDPETCVVKRRRVRLERHAAPISDEDLENSHISHFVKLNPGWSKGHCLVTCCKITPMTLINVSFSAFVRTFLGTTTHCPRPRVASSITKQMSISETLKGKRVFETSFGDPSSFIITSDLAEEVDSSNSSDGSSTSVADALLFE